MFTFSYSLSPNLKKELETIESTRKKVLLERISPRDEIILKFDARIETIISAMTLSGKIVNRDEVKSVLEGKNIKSEAEGKILEYKSRLDFIKRNWLLSEEKVTEEAFIETLDIQKKGLRVSRKDIYDIVIFISVSSENPVVQAGIAFILIFHLLKSEIDTMTSATLAARLILYDYGYDFREALNLEKYSSRDIVHFKTIVNEAINTGNISSFLEYFVEAVSIQAEEVLEKIRKVKLERPSLKQNLELTDRQKQLLSLFNSPEIKITNRSIQSEFHISQITASRDLARLHDLGLIFKGGKGRSVYYTLL